MKNIVALCFVLCLPGGLRAAPGHIVSVAINEVMANPLDEDSGEFVELYNWSDAPVDLAGWRLADAADSNDLIEDYASPHDWGLAGTVLPAGGYAVVVDPEYAGQYNALLQARADSGGVILLTIGKDTTIGNGLTNDGDVVLVSDRAGFTASFAWTSDCGQGISWEKIEAQLGDGQDNWACCQHVAGSTPGFRNSVSRASYDVRVAPGTLQIVPACPWPGQEADMRVTIHNQGKSPADGVEVFFFQDADADTMIDPSEVIGAPQVIAQTLEPDETILVQERWSPPTSGRHLLAVWADCPADEDPLDNRDVLPVQVRYPPLSVAINEIMYDPAPTGEDGQKAPEWVEVSHRGVELLDLCGWTIADSRAQPRSLCDSSNILGPGEYALIAAGTSEEICQAYGPIPCPTLFPAGGLPTLNDDEDLLVLRDPAGTVVDSVGYQAQWGGGGGVSLERINPGLGSGDPLNWGWSVHPSGCTPGGQNSIYADLMPSTSALSVAPNPFSPDGDGRQEVTVISYLLPTATARINLWLFDIRGRRVRTLVDGERCASQGRVLWDGRSDAGQSLPMGIYIVYLEALDERRGLLCHEKTTMVLGGSLD